MKSLLILQLLILAAQVILAKAILNALNKGEPMNLDELKLQVEELEERIAPSATGNPGNNNPPLNNTNNPGNEGTGGQVSTGH